MVQSRHAGVEDLLANVPLFSDSGSKALRRLAKSAVVIDAPRGAMLYRRGDPCNGISFVVSGQVKLAVQTPRRGEMIVELIGPGQSFGEGALFLERPHAVLAQCVAQTRLVHLPKDAVLAELERNRAFARGMIVALSDRLHHVIGGLEDYAMRSGTQRVIGYLLTHLSEESRSNGSVLTLPAQKRIIASQLNLTQEHFSRILHELASQGMIEVRGRNVKILDLDRLRSEAS